MTDFCFDKLGVPPSTAIAFGVICVACLVVAFYAYGILGVLAVLAIAGVVALT